MIEEVTGTKGEPSLWVVEPLDYPRGRGLNIQIVCPDASGLAERLTAAGVPLRKLFQRLQKLNATLEV